MHLQVRQAASMTLVDVAHSIRLEDMGQYVLTIILVEIFFAHSIFIINFRDECRDYLMMRIEKTCA